MCICAFCEKPVEGDCIWVGGAPLHAVCQLELNAEMDTAFGEFMQPDYEMTEAEAVALSGPKNYPKITIKSCPIRGWDWSDITKND
jgi:hypothetical protein